MPLVLLNERQMGVAHLPESYTWLALCSCFHFFPHFTRRYIWFCFCIKFEII